MKYGKITYGRMGAIINELSGMKGVERFLQGELEVFESKHVIDCDANPFIPEGCEVINHCKGGEFKWGQDQIKLYFCDEQKKGTIVGQKLWDKLKLKPALNANLLDYILLRPELIPDSWKGKYIFFWGTIYRGPSVFLCVRYIYWNDNKWDWCLKWLHSDWPYNSPAALYK